MGREIALLTGDEFADDDDLHGEANAAKMHAGILLDDNDRWPWLDRVGGALRPGTVMACSALRRVYRDVLRRHVPEVLFAHLDADLARLAQAGARVGQFMPPTLLQSQIDTLEPLGVDAHGTVVTVEAGPAELAARALGALGL